MDLNERLKEYREWLEREVADARKQKRRAYSEDKAYYHGEECAFSAALRRLSVLTSDRGR